MERIEFRGKTVGLDPQWIYGSLLKKESITLIGRYVITLPTINDPCGDTAWYEEPVIESSIGQFCGYYDKNKEPIYTGDILSFITGHGHMVPGKKVITKPVEFGAFTVRNDTLYNFIGFHIGGSSIKYLLGNGCEITGNDYENPELLTPKQTLTNQ